MNVRREIGITSREPMMDMSYPGPLLRFGSNLLGPSIPIKPTLRSVNSLSERRTDSEQEEFETSYSIAGELT
jgi:hypothetical protein